MRRTLEQRRALVDEAIRAYADHLGKRGIDELCAHARAQNLAALRWARTRNLVAIRRRRVVAVAVMVVAGFVGGLLAADLFSVIAAIRFRCGA